MSHIHYLPLSPAFFSILVGLLVLLIVLIQVGALSYAYLRLGVSSRVALLLLLASLFGSYLNIPVAELPDQQQILPAQEIDFFGMRYAMPVVVDWPGTIIAVNVGGALIPTLMSLYLLARNGMWGLGLLATACVSLVCHYLAQPVAGVGIALPIFVPAIATAIVALVLSRRYAAILSLRRRQPWHADWRRLAQFRKYTGSGSTGGFHRRSRNIRWNFCNRHPGGDHCEPAAQSPPGTTRTGASLNSNLVF